MVYNTQKYMCFSDFVHRPDSKELEEKKHDVSETGSVSVLRSSD
jgi:hypothetical protein